MNSFHIIKIVIDLAVFWQLQNILSNWAGSGGKKYELVWIYIHILPNTLSYWNAIRYTLLDYFVIMK